MRKMVRTLEFDSTPTTIHVHEFLRGSAASEPRTDPPESHAAAWNAFVRCYLVK